jgi:hypothetical protein
LAKRLCQVLQLVFLGAAPFTALVKGAGFSHARNSTRAMKKRIAIGQREKRIEDQKIHTLESHKDAPPDLPKIKTDQRLCLTPLK